MGNCKHQSEGNWMQSFIETQNIAHFKLLLETETHPDKRKILLRLLAEQEAKRTAHAGAELARP